LLETERLLLRTWTLARPHWGHGYATQAAAAVRDWFAAPRLVSLIEPRNHRSAHVAARPGARPTETVPFSDGTPVVVWVHPQGGHGPAR
jgi:RimJ/RimL family protein N-acetyltransferase